MDTIPADLERRLLTLELSMKRLSSDIDSEKRSRAEANAAIQSRIDTLVQKAETHNEKIQDHLSKQDRLLWMGMGGLAVIQVLVVPLLSK